MQMGRWQPPTGTALKTATKLITELPTTHRPTTPTPNCSAPTSHTCDFFLDHLCGGNKGGGRGVGAVGGWELVRFQKEEKKKVGVGVGEGEVWVVALYSSYRTPDQQASCKRPRTSRAPGKHPVPLRLQPCCPQGARSCGAKTDSDQRNGSRAAAPGNPWLFLLLSPEARNN